jgi:hypothetical protein
MTTVDLKVCHSVKTMHHKLRRVSNTESGKFRMISSYPTYKVNNEKKERKDHHMFQMANSQAFKSPNEVKMAELEFLDFIRFTDTYDMHDTLTVHEDLLKNT